VATGVVMSVPAHAPFDWVALKDVQKEVGSGENPFALDVKEILSVTPITLIQAGKEFTEDPAGKLCLKMGIGSQDEEEKLDCATKAIYKDEFHSGILMGNCQEYAGLRVSQAKDALREDFIGMGLADVFYEFSEQVICRSGDDVVVKRIPDQWFIRYSDEEWTRSSKEWSQEMNILPEDYKREMPSVLEWFGDRACIRKGSWLGTEFPYKKGWIIEPISDSTLYPAYYIVSKYLNEGSLKLEWMDDLFFDTVFLGQGDASGLEIEKRELFERIRRDFLYWYPLDVNLSGKEHKTVHFPVFLMNHVALLNREHWPRGIFVHWWVTMSGGDKISKTKGGAEPIPEAILKYGVDAMRLYYCHVGSTSMDVEWVEETVSHYKARIKRIYDQVEELLGIRSGENTSIDPWMTSMMQIRVRETSEFLELGKLREASNVVYFTVPNDIRWYLKRGGSNREVLQETMDIWARMLQPFTPHLAEEIWERMGKEGFVSTTPWPLHDAGRVDPAALNTEEYVSMLLDDLRSIQKMTGIQEPKRVMLYAASDWKWKVLETLFAMVDEGDGRLNPGEVIKKLISDPELSEYRSFIPKMVGKLTKDIVRMGAEERDRFRILRNENDILRSVASFFSTELSCEVKVFSEDDREKEDPAGKSMAAAPLKPAIFME
ncbi:MAG: class I tRNA ligase family protein, partial [Candidatus Thermoplasmatota archaeon]|nr:class I tRNA ligase family protein [Candidatus Thermoplasmatota archaeon]